MSGCSGDLLTTSPPAQQPPIAKIRPGPAMGPGTPSILSSASDWALTVPSFETRRFHSRNHMGSLREAGPGISKREPTYQTDCEGDAGHILAHALARREPCID